MDGGGGASARCRSSAMTGVRRVSFRGGRGRCTAGNGGDAAGDGAADATGGDGGVDGESERCAGSSCTANALRALPASAFATDRSGILGNRNQSAARCKHSDSAAATQMLGIVTTSCRLPGLLRQLLIRCLMVPTGGHRPCQAFDLTPEDPVPARSRWQ